MSSSPCSSRCYLSFRIPVHMCPHTEYWRRRQAVFTTSICVLILRAYVSPYTEYWRRRQAVFQEMLDTIVSICVLTLRAYVSSHYEHMCQAVFQEMLDTISQQERDLSSEVTAV